MVFFAHRAVFLVAPAVIFAALAARVPGVQAAESLADFYQKNGLRMVVASGAGGGYDGYTRVLGRHFAKYLPGHPNIVIQNMPGASGLLATNWAYNAAPRDGSRMLATYSALLDENLVGNKKAKFDVRKFSWIGSISGTQLLCVTWHTSPYKTIRQMVGKEITTSATGRTGNSATMPLILNQLLGTKFKVIMGYSTTGSRLALERGEVDAICGLGISTLRASNPEWFLNKKINIAAQMGLKRHPELPDTPSVIELVTGKERDIIEFQSILQEMGRPYLAPPELPPERLAALRKAFDATMKDADFLKEMDKLKLEVGPLSGGEMDKLIARLYAFPPELVRAVAEIQGVAEQQEVERCDRFTRDAGQCDTRKKKKKKKKSE